MMMGIGHEFVESLANFPQNPGAAQTPRITKYVFVFRGAKF
jgi:hypothetical protein